MFFILLLYLHLSMFFNLLLLFFIHIFFSTSSLTLPWTIAHFYTFSPAHRRVIRDSFSFQPFRYLLAERYGLEWAFFRLQAFFTLRSFTHILTWIYQGFPGGWQFFLEVCRASYWSRNTDPAHLLVWFTVIQHLRIQNNSVLNSTIYWHELLDLSTPYLIRTLFACSKSYM